MLVKYDYLENVGIYHLLSLTSLSTLGSFAELTDGWINMLMQE